MLLTQPPKVNPYFDDGEDDPLLLVARNSRPLKRRRLEEPRRVPNQRHSIPSTPPPIASASVVETSDSDERDALAEPSPRDYWFSPKHRVPIPLPDSPSRSNDRNLLSSSSRPIPSLFRPSSETPQLSSSLATNPEVSSPAPTLRTASEPPEALGASPSRSDRLFSSDAEPMHDEHPRRALRARKQIQLQPYTVENAQYRATLRLRGQKDAIVRLKELRQRSPFGADGTEPQDDTYHLDDSQMSPRPIQPTASDIFGTSPNLPSALRAPDKPQRTYKKSAARQERKSSSPSPFRRAPAPSARARSVKSPNRPSTAASRLSSEVPRRSIHLASLSPSLPSSPIPSPPSPSPTSLSHDEDERARREEAKRKKALERMLPKFMINKLEREAVSEQTRRSRGARRTVSDSSDETSDAGPRRGAGTIRHHTQTQIRSPLRVQGDPDSTSSASSGEDDTDDEIEFLGAYRATSRQRMPAGRRSTPNLSDSDSNPGRRSKPAVSRLKGSSRQSQARLTERSLVDRMLQPQRKRALPLRRERSDDALSHSTRHRNRRIQGNDTSDEGSRSADSDLLGTAIHRNLPPSPNVQGARLEDAGFVNRKDAPAPEISKVVYHDTDSRSRRKRRPRQAHIYILEGRKRRKPEIQQDIRDYISRAPRQVRRIDIGASIS